MPYDKQPWSEFASDMPREISLDYIENLEIGIKSTFNELAHKPYRANTVVDMQAGRYPQGATVLTAGFHEPGDGGKATYQIVAGDAVPIDQIHTFSLSNGLSAVLLINHDTVSLAQLGAKGDYNPTTRTGQDTWPILDKALQLVSTVNAQEGKSYFLSQTITIREQKQLDWKNACVYVDGTDGFHIQVTTTVRPVIRNLQIQQLDYGKHHGVYSFRSDGNFWGSNITLENVYPRDFAIGVIGENMYASDWSHVYPRGCMVGFWIGGTFGNQTSLRECFAYLCTYGFVVENQKNLLLTMPTMEDCDYGIVIDGSLNSDNVTVHTPWFENIRKTYIAYGSVDKNSFVLREDSKQNEKVHIQNARFENVHLYTGTITRNRFQSVYQTEQDMHNLFKLGFQYTNYAGNWIEFGNLTEGRQDFAEKRTPFAERDFCATGIGMMGGYTLGIETAEHFTYKTGDVILLKFLIHSSQDMGIYSYLARGIDITVGASTAELIFANAWKEISAIVKTGDPKGQWGDLTIDAYFFDYDQQKPTDMLVTRPVLVNLTQLFGKGMEPDPALNKSIQSYFAYIPRGKQGRTG